MKKVLLPLIAVCCMAPVAAFAAHPLFTDAAETVEAKKFEAETAIEYSYDKVDVAGGSQKTSVIKIQETITGGLMPHLDAFVTVPYARWKAEYPGGSTTESGLSDITLGAKYGFLHADKTALAVKPFVVIPVGDEKKNLGAGKVGFGATLIGSFEVSKQFALDANAGLVYQGRKGTDAAGEDLKALTTFGGSLAGKFEVSKQLKVVAEAVVSKSDETGSKAEAFAGAGVIFAAMPNLDVDLGARFGLTKESEDLGVLAGLTFKF